MSKSLFFLLLVTLLVTAASFQSGGPWLGAAYSISRAEWRTDLEFFRADLREIRHGVESAPQALKSLRENVQSGLKSIEADILMQAHKASAKCTAD